ncbi:MAG: YebC/PmpR family DNA-binding transcriptional regulator [Chloroflexota bacterium]|nr:YebC/PmpR family DNA-binding transcriptional regulator [Chloroflexota bacterium]
MSGHSKWATIKRKKGATDAKRGQLFTKLTREITISAKEGGGDPEANFRLRLAIQRARSENMPAENIQRAIQRGSGGADGDGTQYEEIIYEGYGPNGVAMLVQTLTDNRNRTVAEIRSAFTKAGGSLGESNSVGWMFEPKGVMVIEPRSGDDADELSLVAIDAGAEDVSVDDDGQVEVVTPFEGLRQVQETLTGQGLQVVSAERTMIPKTTMTLDDKSLEQALRLVDKLEDLDDVQTVYTNLDLSEAGELMANLG